MGLHSNQGRGLQGVGDLLVALNATGNVLTFPKNGMHFYAKSGNTTTAATCGPFTALPVGFRFTLDNTLGSSNLTLVPTTGSTLTVTNGTLTTYVIGADGVPSSNA